METFYLIDFENVHNEGLENIASLSKNDHVHIFSTENALNIRMDIVFSKGIDIQGHIVPVRKQSLDMHLVSYLGHLLGSKGQQCSYVIVSKDTDYDNIIKFWKEEGYPNVSRMQAIPRNAKQQKQAAPQQKKEASQQKQTAPVTQQAQAAPAPQQKQAAPAPQQKQAAPAPQQKQTAPVTQQAQAAPVTQQVQEAPQQKQETLQTANNKISAGMAYDFSGKERSALNSFMQQSLVSMGYAGNTANRICKYVVAHCNDERMLSGIHNDLHNNFDDYAKAYEDVKIILGKFVSSEGKAVKRESQVRSFFGQHFKKKIYVDMKEEIIHIILNAQTKQQVNNGLLKLYSDGNVVKHIYKTVQPLIKELPGE